MTTRPDQNVFVKPVGRSNFSASNLIIIGVALVAVLLLGAYFMDAFPIGGNDIKVPPVAANTNGNAPAAPAPVQPIVINNVVKDDSANEEAFISKSVPNASWTGEQAFKHATGQVLEGITIETGRTMLEGSPFYAKLDESGQKIFAKGAMTGLAHTAKGEVIIERGTQIPRLHRNQLTELALETRGIADKNQAGVLTSLTLWNQTNKKITPEKAEEVAKADYDHGYYSETKNNVGLGAKDASDSLANLRSRIKRFEDNKLYLLSVKGPSNNPRLSVVATNNKVWK
jgi:hypothetical protein